MANCRLLSILIVAVAVALASTSSVGGHNITAILEGFPEYALYNSYLSKTRVCDEINARETVTCLVLSDSQMSALVTDAKSSLAGIKNALRLLTLLDYYDPQKLHGLPDGSTLATTLHQATGNAPGNLGFVNVTDLRGGKVAFASASPGATFDAAYTKTVKQIPFNISIVEISAPVTYPGLFDAPSAATANLTALLEKAGCKTFASLLEKSGVLKMYESAMAKGLTLFAPNDDAFQAAGAPDVESLSSADLVTLLEYHALPSYNPKASLKSVSEPMPTLASSAGGKYQLSVSSSGDDVKLDTGVDTSRVASTVLDDTPVCILTVDNLLLPVELFAGAPAPAPGPAAPAPAPAPSALAPSPADAFASPPAPPAEAPAADKKKGKADLKAAAATVSRPVAAVVALVSAAALAAMVQ